MTNETIKHAKDKMKKMDGHAADKYKKVFHKKEIQKEAQDKMKRGRQGCFGLHPGRHDPRRWHRLDGGVFH